MVVLVFLVVLVVLVALVVFVVLVVLAVFAVLADLAVLVVLVVVVVAVVLVIKQKDREAGNRRGKRLSIKNKTKKNSEAGNESRKAKKQENVEGRK